MVRQTPSRARTLPPSAPLSQQVGGHSGVQVTEDESLLLKPALLREVTFYQLVRDIVDPSTGLNALKQWMPRFFGLLNLEGKLADPDNIDAETVPSIVPVSQSEETPHSGGTEYSDATPTSNMNSQTLVLQNLLHGYRKPCVLDVKLGTILYDEDASEEKKARMIQKAAETTTLQTGVRLTGFQVYSDHSPDPIVYGKKYGYSLRPDQLQEGIRSFFPSSVSVTNADLDPSYSTAGLPTHILLTVLTSIHGSLTDLRNSFARTHLRMVGSSVLIIYEADWERATAASGRGGGPNSLEEDVLEEDEDEGDGIEAEIDEQGNIITEVSSGTASETSSVCSDTGARARSYTVSLIDFAHTRIVPGEGPDPGVLLGLDTLIRLVDQRKQEVAGSVGNPTT